MPITRNFKISKYTAGCKRINCTLPCTPPSAKFLCSPPEASTLRKINLDLTSQTPETKQALNELCEEYKDIFSLHQGDIGHTKLLTVDIDMGDPSSYCTKTLHSTSETYQSNLGRCRNVKKG